MKFFNALLVYFIPIKNWFYFFAYILSVSLIGNTCLYSDKCLDRTYTKVNLYMELRFSMSFSNVKQVMMNLQPLWKLGVYEQRRMKQNILKLVDRVLHKSAVCDKSIWFILV